MSDVLRFMLFSSGTWQHGKNFGDSLNANANQEKGRTGVHSTHRYFV